MYSVNSNNLGRPCVQTSKTSSLCLHHSTVIEWHFFMHFYVPFHFFKLPFDFSFLPKHAFCKAKVQRGIPKGKKRQFSFSRIKRHFFMHFYVLFHFLKVPFDLACLRKAGFCKDKAHRGTPKGGKMSVLYSLIERQFFYVFLRAISFFLSSFRFFRSSKTSILQG